MLEPNNDCLPSLPRKAPNVPANPPGHSDASPASLPPPHVASSPLSGSKACFEDIRQETMQASERPGMPRRKAIVTAMWIGRVLA